MLLDRSPLPYPQPTPYDLVGIDNRGAGYAMTEHLLQAGCRRVAFVGERDSASTIDAREAGYWEVLYTADAFFERALIYRGDPQDVKAIRTLMKSLRPDGFVCANDRTAGRVMHSLRHLD